MLAAELALTREEAQLAACALLDVLPERCFTQGRCPLLRQNCLDVKKCDNRPGLHIPLLYRA